jgi:glycosyltransferase involved in cell wall biosynthesis
MKFLLDLQTLQSESRSRGIGRYCGGLAQALLTGPDGGNALTLLNSAIYNGETFDEVKQFISRCGAADRLHVLHGLERIQGRLSAKVSRLRAAETLYDAFVNSLGADIVHIASPFEGYSDETVVGWTELSWSGPLRAATVFDLIPFEESEVELADPTRSFWYRRRYAGLAKADVYLAISEHTRQVTMNLLNVPGDRVVNILADADAKFRKIALTPDERSKLLARYRITKPFVMHTGVLEARKNVATLIRAFALLPPELKATHEIVVVADATPPQMAVLNRVAREAGLNPSQVVFTGFVPDEDLVGIYGQARAFVMASLTEGFGLPLLEAMRCGAPVLGSERTSVPEVVGNAEYLFDPARPEALAEKLVLMLTDDGYRQRALAHAATQEKKFSWRESAARVSEAFKDTIARGRRLRQAPPQPKQYILVPPRESDEALQARIGEAAAALRKAGETAVFDHQADSKGLDLLDVSPGRRLLMMLNGSGLDPFQQKVVAQMPAVALLPDAGGAQPATPESIYWTEGYPGLVKARREGFPQAGLESLPDVRPNVLGTVRGTAGLVERVEAIYASHPLRHVLPLIRIVGDLEAEERIDVAAAVSENHGVAPQRPRLLVDISEFFHRDAGTGIQRVVRSMLSELLTQTHDFRVEPIFRDGDHYRYARDFTCRFVGVPPIHLPNAVVDFYPSDTYLGLDSDPLISQRAAETLARFRRRGGAVNFVVYDLLPLLWPDWFPEGTEEGYTEWVERVAQAATRLIAISRSAADTAIEQFERKAKRRFDQIEVSWYHNGSDFLAVQAHSVGRDPAVSRFLDNLPAGVPVFLTVGTLEPRKGIQQLLDAAENLWRDGDAVFVLVGKQGWMVDSLIDRIQRHPQVGKRLFWFGDRISDASLDAIYRKASAVVLPSEAEGFGLPLVEAAVRGVPVVARDLPVFREIAGDNAYFFRAGSGAELAIALRSWMALSAKRQAPSPAGIKSRSWHDSARQLLEAVRGERPYRRWPETGPATW